ncbi:MAG: carboxypeptidase regulatory-like domain-containing protein [Williamsia sp.]|nr:carboxypeptidase regulatory-like domain-containing protein [Williamsia sp.]
MKISPLNALFFLFSICLLLAFKPLPAAKQGIEGYLYKVSGNMMPGPGVNRPAPRGTKAILYIFELTNTSQVTRKDPSPFYSAIKTKLVKQVSSNSKGRFSVQLPPGRYSLFVKKGALYYANQYDDKNNIFPVEVLPGKMTKVEFRIDYNAVY